MTIVYVAATGGHLAQLRALAPRIAFGDDGVWVTFDTPQSRSLLADEVHDFIPYIAPRDWPGVVRAVPHAVRLLRARRPSLVVSTGNAIALTYLPVARLLGIPAAYIESAARATGPSLTGRLIRRLPGVQLFTQYESWAAPPWRYVGSIFDGYAAVDVTASGPIRRILVTLGTIPFDFSRAVGSILSVIPDDCEVIWQVGETDVGHLGIDAVQTMPAATLAREMERADVVIAHAGIGSVLGALAVGKTPILLPRAAMHSEHIDDHQMQIAEMLDARRLALRRDPGSLSADDLALARGRRVEHRAEASPLPIVRR